MSSVAVHPRVCGEQMASLTRDSTFSGSSPRVRGTVHPTGGQCRQWRFIPACAGNRQIVHFLLIISAVHPRVCGEQFCNQFTAPTGVGSSPRVRGTARPDSSHAGPRRFIPACAGNRVACVTDVQIDPVHPRVCGEQTCPAFVQSILPGSSPRVRGTVGSYQSTTASDRFIPACAGNSFADPVIDTNATVHPRVCGEQYLRRHSHCAGVGSSPRVRGTEHHDSQHHDRVCGEQRKRR